LTHVFATLATGQQTDQNLESDEGEAIESVRDAADQVERTRAVTVETQKV